ncbi:MAG: peptidase M49 [Vicinamibacterales bacterium]
MPHDASTRHDATAVASRRYLLERVDDAAIVQLYADGFDQLTLDQKTLVWHLYQAALAGRDIYTDQRYRHALEMRDFLEALVLRESALAPDVAREVWRYTKLFWINSGPFNNLTARKFVLRLSVEALVAAATAAAAAGARFACRPGEAPGDLARRLAPYLLDPSVDPMVTNKSPGAGGDILRDSANNLYDGVTMADLESVVERHPLNSRLVKRDGVLVEEVYRVGGRYGAELAQVVEHLEAAIRWAPPRFAGALEALVRWYRSGDDEDRAAFDVAWVTATDSPVDTMNGFIEVYMDARGMKGAWEGMVYYVNRAKTARIEALAAHAQWFEDRMPIAPMYRKPVVQGVTASAIEVVIETGDAGPITPIGVNLPNDQRVREAYGSKSVTLANVTEAYELSTTDEYRREFAWSDEEFQRAKRWGGMASEIATEIHEVLGHGSGRMNAAAQAQPQELLREQYSALEETRADLVALYFCADPMMVELGLVQADEFADVVRTEYESYARTALVQLRRVREGTQLEEDHMRNRQAIVHWLLAHTRAISVRIRNGRTYHVVDSVAEFREGVARMLHEVQRIKSEGDYAAARELFDTYGVHFDASLRDEIVARVDALNLPSYTAFVMPTLTPVHDAHGAITDVMVSYSCDFAAQMLAYSAHRRA